MTLDDRCAARKVAERDFTPPSGVGSPLPPPGPTKGASSKWVVMSKNASKGRDSYINRCCCDQHTRGHPRAPSYVLGTKRGVAGRGRQRATRCDSEVR